MFLLILSLLNWIFVENNLLKLGIALVIFIVVEVKRKNGSASKSMVAAEFISALILTVYLLMVTAGLIARFA